MHRTWSWNRQLQNVSLLTSNLYISYLSHFIYFIYRVNPNKKMTIQRKLKSYCAENLELKQIAQRCFIAYIKSINLISFLIIHLFLHTGWTLIKRWQYRESLSLIVQRIWSWNRQLKDASLLTSNQCIWWRIRKYLMWRSWT